ncbi:MAG: hypothetical protein AB7J28_04010 [Hyphomonadaceae bacterium]
MADGSGPIREAAAALQAPALTWRRPGWLWAGIVLILSVAWPLFFLRAEGGWGQFAAICVGASLLLALGAIGAAHAIGKPPRLRRHVVIYVMAASVAVAFIAPFVFMALLDFLVTAERNGDQAAFEIAGLSGNMAWALAPLALLVGSPCALVAGLALSLLGFRKTPATPPGVLIARRRGDQTILHDPRREIDHTG